MTTIVTRAGKGSALTIAEMDANFTNLNTAKIESSLIAFTTLTASNPTFTPNVATKRLVVRVRGGGGAGGGTTTSVANIGLGGHAGAVVWGSTATVSGTYNATIGVGGTTLGAGLGGNNGGNSTFVGTGLNLTAVGGNGGIAQILCSSGANGEGGHSGEGLGGARQATSGADGNAAAANTGAGGGGACNTTGSIVSNAGGTGGSGIIDIWEFNL